MKFILLGVPIAKARHRHRGKFTYDPQQKEKDAVRWLLQVEVTKAIHNEDKEIVKNASLLAMASSFRVKLTFHIPSTKLDLWGLKECVCKKDIDNISKFYLDCANGILFSDDHKIVELHAKKVYSPIPRTVIEIEPMNVTTKISNDAEQVLKVFTPNDMTEMLDDIWCLTKFHSCDLEVIEESEKQQWFNDIGSEIAKFAHKHATKLKKVQTKTAA